MKKIGQENGYAMAALLIAMSIAAVLLTVAMPTWKQMSRREKEEELVFRGQQYVRAIRLYGMKFANANPPSIDVLVEQRYLRKKFKDPITNDDFQPILAGQAIPGSSGAGAGAARGGQQAQVRGPNAGPITSGGSQVGGRGGAGSATGGLAGIGGSSSGPVGGLMGVMSKSKDASIKIYNGRNHYNEWAFVYVPQVQAPGVGGVGGVGGRGQPTQPNNPFGTGIGGRDGRGGRGNPNLPPQPIGPGRGPTSPITPIQPGRGRGL